MHALLRRLSLPMFAGLLLGGGVSSSIAVASEPPTSLHLYGEAAAPGLSGTTYMVFRAQQQRVVGAFYQPNSTFNCFYGEVAPGQMNLTVVDSYTQTAHPYAVATSATATQVASTTPTGLGTQPANFFAIEPASEMDRQLVETCSRQYPL